MKLGEMKIAEQQNRVHKIFRGDKKEGRVSCVAVPARDDDTLSDLFEQDPDKPDQNSCESSIILSAHIKQSFLEQGMFKPRLLKLAKDHTVHARKAMPIACERVNESAGEPLRLGSTVTSIAESTLDGVWVTCDEANGASKNNSPEDEGNSPEGSNSPSSGGVVEACPENWFLLGLVSLVSFGPSEGRVETQRVLDLSIPKDPPADHTKEFSWLAAKKKAAARESATRRASLSGGMAK